ncbi:MAG: flagellar hook-associated protein FlgK [Candidatus Caldatribacterium sp.]|uniref:flagellar hook-associated protein FlgK n=1 Tax=Candidatus Caldatribacterium sp. TaxID=2282143 RepID=UPI0029953380|nr:flagellar hook-associated protein FlgK [Candidatus Caldatribacterium sp.]MCX7730465.1 flagellar hook-associated protein FlgK [Candidatus Caldatribacterium sp.]MDW8081951.1 flagellar hook-associated protein FlgK [Candidatus Calescibacterium sp.]
MRTIFLGLEIARKALQTHQAAMNVTAHNIANANTVGYTRQVPHLTQETVPLSGLFVPPHLKNIGLGVDVDAIRRMRDRFIDLQIRQESRTGAYWNTIDQGLEQIEVIFGEPHEESGLSQIFDRFWNTWQELAKSPESQASRVLVAETGSLLAQAMNHTYRQLEMQRQELNEKVAIKVQEVNSYIQQIYDLNQQIVRVAPAGGNINDYKDQLDVLVDNLSKILQVQVRENDNGTYTIVLQGRILAHDRERSFLSLEVDASGMNRVTLENGEAVDFTYQNGELKAVFDLRDVLVPKYQEALNVLAQGLRDAVNAVHRRGFTLEVPPRGGGDFFVGSRAEDLAVHPDILGNPMKIAASLSGAPGDGENALAIAQLRGKPVISGSSPDDYYRGIISRLGVEREEAQRIAKNQDVLVQQLENRRESVSGVSLDEEMTNLIRYQYAYQAASILVRTIDEMLDTVVHRIK